MAATLKPEVKMLRRNMFLKYMNEEQLGEQPQGGSAEAEVEDEPQTVSMADFKALQESNNAMSAKMNELLGEKKAEQKKRQEEAAAREAAELEAKKQAGNFEEFETGLRKQFEQTETGYKNKIEMFTGKLVNQSKKAAQSDFLDKFIDKGTAALALDKMIHVTLDDELNPVREFRDLNGQLITTDPEQFMEYLSDNHKGWIKGVQSSGALDTAQRPSTTGGGNGALTDKEKRIAEINKRLGAK